MVAEILGVSGLTRFKNSFSSNPDRGLAGLCEYFPMKEKLPVLMGSSIL